MNSNLILHQAIFAPFVLITMWYLVDNSQRQFILGNAASKIKRCGLQEREILEERKAKERFSKIHNEYKKVFISSLIPAALSLFVPVENITLLEVIILSILYSILCIIYALYGYAKSDTKYAWIFIGIVCYSYIFTVFSQQL